MLKTLILLTVTYVTLLGANGYAEEVEWDILPNGLMELIIHEPFQDRTELHRVMRSEYTARPVSEVKQQAQQDGLWAFFVEYDHDRFVYFIEVEPARICYGECP